jgi:hypothetical protein
VGAATTSSNGIALRRYREEIVVGRHVDVDPLRHGCHVEALAELAEDPPHRPPRTAARHDFRGVLGGHEVLVLIDVVGDVGALELTGRREHMGGPPRRLGLDDIGAGEHLERAERTGDPRSIRERSDDVAADDEQRRVAASISSAMATQGNSP